VPACRLADVQWATQQMSLRVAATKRAMDTQSEENTPGADTTQTTLGTTCGDDDASSTGGQTQKKHKTKRETPTLLHTHLALPDVHPHKESVVKSVHTKPEEPNTLVHEDPLTQQPLREQKAEQPLQKAEQTQQKAKKQTQASCEERKVVPSGIVASQTQVAKHTGVKASTQKHTQLGDNIQR
jgi:hypothetical protein